MEVVSESQPVTNQELMARYSCGNSGGMRRSHTANTLVLISDHTKALYDDRWEGNIFHYTGMGKSGDQSLTYRQNKTLTESAHNNVRVHLYEVFQKDQYLFVGEVELAGTPHQEKQPGEDQQLRLAWVYPLRLKSGQAPPAISDTAVQALSQQRSRTARRLSNAELLERARQAPPKPSRRAGAGEIFVRNEFVAEHAKRRAGGKCDLCGQPAPFNDRRGAPYLECHHVEWLSRGGLDTIENTVALCANCHRRMHVLDLPQERTVLLQQAQKLLT